jgi:hypothetical protein
VYKASNAEYNEHRIVCISPIAAEIRWIRFSPLKVGKCSADALDFTGNTVNTAQTGRRAVYKASNAEYNEHRIVFISPIAGEIH